MFINNDLNIIVNSIYFVVPTPWCCSSSSSALHEGRPGDDGSAKTRARLNPHQLWHTVGGLGDTRRGCHGDQTSNEKSGYAVTQTGCVGAVAPYRCEDAPADGARRALRRLALQEV